MKSKVLGSRVVRSPIFHFGADRQLHFHFSIPLKGLSKYEVDWIIGNVKGLLRSIRKRAWADGMTRSLEGREQRPDRRKRK